MKTNFSRKEFEETFKDFIANGWVSVYDRKSIFSIIDDDKKYFEITCGNDPIAITLFKYAVEALTRYDLSVVICFNRCYYSFKTANKEDKEKVFRYLRYRGFISKNDNTFVLKKEMLNKLNTRLYGYSL